MKPYYYVYRPGNLPPTIKHKTFAEAQAEAERLAAKHVGTPFEILKAVAISQVISPATTFFMDGCEDGF
jgi:hypothetical protein